MQRRRPTGVICSASPRSSEAYIRHLAEADPSTLRVSLADKLYNGRETLLDLEREGQRVWESFNRPREESLWYYRALLDAYRGKRGDDPLVREMARIVAELSA